MITYIHTFTLLLFSLSAFAQTMNTALLSEKCKAGVVYIETESGLGTGFLVSEEGHIVTNYHVMDGGWQGSKIEFSDGSIFRSYSIGNCDEDHDIAILKINNFPKGRYPVLSILASGNGKDGIEAATIGHPKGSKWSITKGIVSKEIVLEELDYIAQIDVPVNPGNSGGPLFNKNGLVVGVVTARLEKKSIFDRDIQNMNFAITATELRKFLSRRGVRYKTKAPIDNMDLNTGMRELTKEEIEAEKAANLTRIKEKEAADKELLKETTAKQKELLEEEAEAEKERIRKENERDLQRLEQQKWNEQLNAQQSRAWQQQQFEERTAKQAMQAKIDLQRMEEQKQREWIQLERDKLKLEQDKIQQNKNKKNYYANLPGRFGLRIGAGAVYTLGAIEDLSSFNVDLSPLSWQTSGSLTYRFDIRNKLRGTAVGIFGDFGNLNTSALNQLQQQQQLNAVDSRNLNLFYEWELGFLLREWLRLSAGMGKQELYRTNIKYPENYGTGTVGFIIRKGHLELDWNNSIYFGGLYQKPALSTQLSLMVHFKMAKF